MHSKILLLGDSLTQTGWDGWAGRLAHVYQRRADVVNRGMSGYNTKWYLEYCEQSDVWKLENVKLITIFFGANDAASLELNPRHHVPIPDFMDNLETLVTKSREAYGKDVDIILLTAPPVVHSQRLAYQKQRYGDKATGELERNLELSQQHAIAVSDVAAKHSLPCINLWTRMQEEQNWNDFFYDGLHFTSLGGEFVYQQILETIGKELKDLSVTPCLVTGYWANSASSCPSLPHDGPHHDEIDYKNHKAAFQK